MPRRDGNHPSARRRHTKPRHSGRKGSGSDRKKKAQKKLLGDPREMCSICHRPVARRAAHLRDHHDK
jgi:hypothetical protein